VDKAAGVHHVGFGVRNLKAAETYYQQTLGFSAVLEAWEDSVNSMADTYRNSPHNYAGFMSVQPAGGIIIEPIFKKWPTPRPIQATPRYGDIGVNKLTIAVSDPGRLFQEYPERIDFFGSPVSVDLPGLGPYEFVYAKGPDGNIIEFAAWAGAPVKDGLFGGARILGLSVTDLERSKAFYQAHCGFDVVVGEHDRFSGHVGDISGQADTRVRSCLLDSSRRKPGRGGMIELYEVSNPRGRSIPFGTEWGDFGYMEVCLFYPGNILDLHKYFLEQGLDVPQRPTCFGRNEQGTVDYWFLYVRDPDGILIESVGYHARP